MKYRSIVLIIMLILFAGTARSQTTAFSYQGSLTNGGPPANGSFDFEFALFSALSGGTQVGTTLTRLNVPVVNGIFTVSLDFGNNFPGASRFLEVRVRQSGSGGFTQLLPRHAVGSAPYSIKSLSTDNAAQLGGVSANQYVITSDPRLSDARNPLAGSSNYIQNQNAGPQASSNFNISGNGTAGGLLSAATVNATTQYNLNGNRILRQFGLGNLFIGFQSGEDQTDSNGNNTFVGSAAGRRNTSSTGTGSANAFFGFFSGSANTIGNANSYYGHGSGSLGLVGNNNSFFGQGAGFNSNADSNSFFGVFSGTENTTGTGNAFFGANSGDANVSGARNTILGTDADVGAGNLSNATAIGNRSLVTQSNSLILGSILGVNGATSGTRIGIGTSAPEKEFHLRGPSNVELQIESSDTGGRKWSLQASAGASDGRFEIVDRTINANRMTILDDGNVGVGTTAPLDKLHVSGIIRVSSLGAAGATHLCRNASNQISTCTVNRTSEVLVDAVQKQVELQQKEIESQRSLIEQQRGELDAMKAHICQQTPSAPFCLGKDGK